MLGKTNYTFDKIISWGFNRNKTVDDYMHIRFCMDSTKLDELDSLNIQHPVSIINSRLLPAYKLFFNELLLVGF